MARGEEGRERGEEVRGEERRGEIGRGEQMGERRGDWVTRRRGEERWRGVD